MGETISGGLNGMLGIEVALTLDELGLVTGLRADERLRSLVGSEVLVRRARFSWVVS